MAAPTINSTYTSKRDSLLQRMQKANDQSAALLSELNDLAPHMISPDEWVKLQTPRKLLEFQTRLEYAIWHERTGNEMKIPTKEEVDAMRMRYKQLNTDPPSSGSQFQKTPESERADSQISELRLGDVRRGGMGVLDSRVRMVGSTTSQLGDGLRGGWQGFTPQRQAVGQVLRMDGSEMMGSESVVSRSQQAAFVTANTNKQATKKPATSPPKPTSPAQPNIHHPAIESTQQRPINSNNQTPAPLKRRRRATSEESENSDYNPTSSAESTPSVSPSPSASPRPASTLKTGNHGAPPAKRRAPFPTTPVRRLPPATLHPSFTPRPASALKGQTPLTPSMGTTKTNHQLLADFVPMSITEINMSGLDALQAKFKGIKALDSFSTNTAKGEMMSRFMDWQNTMLELERGEGEGNGEPEVITPSRSSIAAPSQTNTPLGRRKFVGKSDEELLGSFVYQSVKELNGLKVDEIRGLVRGVEGLRRFFNGLTKTQMIGEYMKWQREMVDLKRKREEEEDEEMEEEEDEEMEEDKEMEEAEEMEQLEETEEQLEEELAIAPASATTPNMPPTKATATKTTPIIIDLISDSEDDDSGETMPGIERHIPDDQDTRIVEV